MDRRTFLAAMGLLAVGAGLPEGTVESSRLEALPDKSPLLKLTYRPPNYETPLSAFTGPITANEDFFVRYHLAGIPRVKADTYRLWVNGREFSLEQLRGEFEQAEVTAVCQCSGNRRGLCEPHVPGVQWGYGAMGNAVWRGPRLRDLLGDVPEGAVEVSLAGADKPVAKGTPPFVKSIPLYKALDENVLVALDMNGVPLPHYNGFPARLVVPGWTATYWMKHLERVEVLDKPLTDFWMANAYRVPAGMFPTRQGFPSQATPEKVPITEILVNSIITSPVEGARVKGPVTVKGLAWDGGYGIREVDVAAGDGPFVPATLGKDLGRFSFREFSAEIKAKPGPLSIRSRATNALGRTQQTTLAWNPAGYNHNVIFSVGVEVV